MASDNKLLMNRKQRYKVVDFYTNKIYADGFTSQKAASDWMKENKKEGIRYSRIGYFPTH